MAIQRHFLGFAQPVVSAAADYLLKRFRTPRGAELDGVVVVTPGGRAGRRLLEILLEKSRGEAGAFLPPQVVTVGGLPELFYRAKFPLASDLTQRLVWASVLREFDRAKARTIIRHLPDAGREADWKDERWLEMGRLLAVQHRELAGEGYGFGDVAEAGSRLAEFNEANRWRTLAEMQEEYHRRLDRLAQWDVQTARRYAVKLGECTSPREVVLLGAVDLDRTMRAMLDQVADRVTVLIAAPEEWSARFDGHGCVIPEAWSGPVGVDLERVRVVTQASDQATAVVEAIAAWDGAYRADEITIGAAEEGLVGQLSRRLAEAGVPHRYGPGWPLGTSGPVRLLAAAGRYLERPRFTELAALVRQVDLAEHLSRKLGGGSWLSALDDFQAKRLPYAIDRDWLKSHQEGEPTRVVYDEVTRLLAPLSGGAPRPFVEWGEAIGEFLLGVYGGRTIDWHRAADRMVLRACEAIQEATGEWERIPAEVMPRMGADAAVALVVEAVSQVLSPPPADAGAVEILGWLELPLDDAPAMVVTSLNEGIVPTSVHSDMFLPNALRATLGLDDNQRRYARDAYALSVLQETRRSLVLVCSRQGPEGDPRVPSRLLLDGGETEIAGRVIRLFGMTLEEEGGEKIASRDVVDSAAATTAGKGKIAASGEARSKRPVKSGLLIPLLGGSESPLGELSVTDFAAYLRCPYRFFLERVLRLKMRGDDSSELDPLQFGDLLHEVLKRFGEGPARESSDAEEIDRFCQDALTTFARDEYGSTPLASVRVQVEQVRPRLRAFAARQAERFAAGWRIEYVERKLDKTKPNWEVDGKAITLKAKIDRIDVHATTGERCILDYKTGESGQTPEKKHRQSKSGEWVDLQLPLYRMLAGSLGITSPVQVGYFVLPRDPADVGVLLAEWSETDYRSAEEAARNVVRRIWASEFGPPEEIARPEDDSLGPICQTGVFERRWAGDAEAKR